MHEWHLAGNIVAMNPFEPALLRRIAQAHGTPLWVYDAETIRQRIASLQEP